MTNKIKQSYFVITLVALILFVISYQITMKTGDAISRKIFVQ